MNPPKAVSLFAGIGGICMGFKQAGFQIVWANEKDPAACRTYRYNFGNDYLVEGDIRKVDKASIPSADILIAGFPCQSFSVGGKAKGFSDPRGQLFFEVINVASALRPPVIFLENVENLMDHDEGHTFQVIYTSLVELGYIVRYCPMATHEYAGIPQTRRRIYIVAFLDYNQNAAFHFPEPIPLKTTVMQWINPHKQCPDIYYYNGDTEFDQYIRSNVTDSRYLYRVFNGTVRKLTNGKCPTLTASMCSPRNAAVMRDDYGVRRLTLRECLRFQGFPEEFYFPNSITLADAYRQIGNSVSVPVVRRIAEEIRKTM